MITVASGSVLISLSNRKLNLEYQLLFISPPLNSQELVILGHEQEESAEEDNQETQEYAYV